MALCTDVQQKEEKKRLFIKSYIDQDTRYRSFENSVIVWFNPDLYDIKKSKILLQEYINEINIFSDFNKIVNWIKDVKEEKIYLILSNSFEQTIILQIYDLIQLDSIYIFSFNTKIDDQSIKNYKKIKGIFSNINLLCEQLKKDLHNTEYDSIGFDIIPNEDISSNNINNKQEALFMYAQLFKELLLETKDEENIEDLKFLCDKYLNSKDINGQSLMSIDFFNEFAFFQENANRNRQELISIYNERQIKSNKMNKKNLNIFYQKMINELENKSNSMEELIKFAEEQYIDNSKELEIIDEFQKKYHQSQAINWYTRETFLYRMINKALRVQDHLTLYALRRFTRDLHIQLVNLQTQNKIKKNKLILYRGLAISDEQLQKIKNNSGGLLSMNNFISTSENKDIAINFARLRKDKTKTIAVLFEIELNPMESSNTPYANIDQFSFFGNTEKEYLFSMGAVFRISSITIIENNIYCIHLKFTKENDEQLENLTKYMRQELKNANSLYHKFGLLMINMSHFKEAEYFYRTQILHEEDWMNYARTCHQLSIIYSHMKQFDEALKYSQQSLEISEKNMSSNDSRIATCCNAIGSIYWEKKEFDIALKYYERAKTIYLSITKPNPQKLSQVYNNIATVLADQNKLDQALDYHKKNLDILNQHLPAIHPAFAITFGNMGGIYLRQGNNQEALNMCEKCLSIMIASLPANHEHIANAHSNISITLRNLNRHKEALEHALKAIEISKNVFGEEHSTTQSYIKILSTMNDSKKN